MNRYALSVRSLVVTVVCMWSSGIVNADTIFADSFGGSHPGLWFIGHDGGGGNYSWAWPQDYAFAYADPNGSMFYYPNNLHVYMERRFVSLAGYASATLTFDRIVDTESGPDYFSINVRDQAGQWHGLFLDSGPTDPLVWTTTQVDLSQFVNVLQGNSLVFVVRGEDADGNLNLAEWYRDGGFPVETDDMSGSVDTASRTEVLDDLGPAVVEAVVYDTEWANDTARWDVTVLPNPACYSVEVRHPEDNALISGGELNALHLYKDNVLDQEVDPNSGSYTFNDLDPDHSYRIEAYGSDMWVGSVVEFLSPGEEANETITTPYRGTLQVRVFGNDGLTPIDGVDVQVRSHGNTAWRYGTSEPGGWVSWGGSDRAYLFPNQQSGEEWIIHAEYSGKAVASPSQVDITEQVNEIRYITTTVNAPSEIEFAGLQWDIRPAGIGGPGPNAWSPSTENVWVDAEGKLHLGITERDGVWHCAAVVAQQIADYGSFVFYVDSRVDLLDINVVVGLFVYENDVQEIDIEFARWGNASNPNVQYVIQPSSEDSTHTFGMSLNGDYSTHRFIWEQDQVAFDSYHGHGFVHLMESWTFTDSDLIPVPSGERVHLNLWLSSGNPPSNGESAEVVISAVAIEPLSCPWDCADGDDNVGIIDFLALLADWSNASACDFDGGGVDITDFLKLLANWGPCP